MAMAKWHRPIQDEAGNLITSSLQVTVRHQATAALAKLFADRDGVSNKSNPFTVTDGEPFFYAVGGMYSVRVVGSGYDETFSDQPVGTGGAVDADSLLLPGYLYEFETTTTAPPSAGSIRANNADLSLATELYIDDDNVGGTDFSAIFLALDPGTKSQKNRIILTSQAAGQQVSWDVDGVSDESGYVTLTVSGHVGVTTLPVTSRINAVLQLSGPDGVHPGFHFVFDGASTADSDPGAGKFRLNNADPSLTTAIYIDNVETLAGASVTTWLDSFDDGLNSIKGELAIIANSDASIFLTYNVTGSVVDGTGYRKLTVEYVAHGGALNDATLCVMEFVPRGDAGVSPGYRLTMDAASTTDSDPGAGKVRFNHGTFASITEVYVDNVDQGAGDITAWLDGLDDVVNANARAYLRFQAVGDATVYAEFAVTGTVSDGTGYRKIPVSPVAGAVPADATLLVASAAKSGADGAGTGDVTGDTASTAGNVAVFSDTTGKAIEDSGVSVADLQAAGRNAALFALKIADLEGDRMGMFGGIADPFDDETDVDTATSTNESYDSGNDLYSPVAIVGTSTYSQALAANVNHTQITIRNVIDAAQISASGNQVRVRIEGPSTGTAKTFANVFIGHAATSGDAYDFDGNQVRVTFSGSNSVTPPVGSTVWSDWIDFALDETKDVIVAIDGDATSNATRALTSGAGTGVIAYFKTSVQEADTTDVTGYTAQSGNLYYMNAIEVRDGPFENMTLVSNAFTAAAEPDTGRIAVQVVENESITVNTDLTAEISRDGGTTWTAATLALVSDPVGSYKIYEDSSVDVSGQPSGTSMKYRIKTLNNKDIDVSGVVLQWS